MLKVRVKQFVNHKGTTAKNQFIIFEETSEGDAKKVYLQSYDSIVCCFNLEEEVLTFGRHYDYSKTTMKYLVQFMQTFPALNVISSIKDVRRLIKEGGYKLPYNAKKHIAVRYDNNMQ